MRPLSPALPAGLFTQLLTALLTALFTGPFDALFTGPDAAQRAVPAGAHPDRGAQQPDDEQAAADQAHPDGVRAGRHHQVEHGQQWPPDQGRGQPTAGQQRFGVHPRSLDRAGHHVTGYRVSPRPALPARSFSVCSGVARAWSTPWTRPGPDRLGSDLPDTAIVPPGAVDPGEAGALQRVCRISSRMVNWPFDG